MPVPGDAHQVEMRFSGNSHQPRESPTRVPAFNLDVHMTAILDPYSVLNVDRSATKDEIRKSFKKLARKHHPDANPDDPSALEKFKQVSTAWEILSDDEKRKKYDQYGSPDGPRFRDSSAGAAGPGDAHPWSWSSTDGGEVPIDIEQLFGGTGQFGGFGFGGGHGPVNGSRGNWPMRGHDVRAEIEVPFHVAAEGGNYDLHLQRGDSGRPETLTVRIPSGIDSGRVIRLAEQGEPGINGGTAGDLLVSIRVVPHPYFRRDGAHLLLDLPLGIVEATLGTKVDIPTLSEGMIEITVPAGVSSGTKLRLKGKGIADRRSGQRGDQFAVIKIVTPKNLSDTAREKLEQFSGEVPQSPRDGLWK